MSQGALDWAAWEGIATRWMLGAFLGLLGAVLLAGAVALLNRTLGRRLPTAAHAWLWWLVCFKLVLAGGLWWLPHAPLSVPASLLPSTLSRLAIRPTAAPGLGKDDSGIPAGLAGPGAPHPATVAPTVDATSRSARWPGVPVLLMLTWAIGVLVAIGGTAVTTARLHRALRREAHDLTGESIAGEARLLAVALGLPASPRLMASPAATAPLVVGLHRPRIFLPPDFADALSPPERRMALAHELAHVCRGDLWRDLAPLAARALWWFVPVLPGLAWREWATAREAACDALALQVTEAAPGEYSRLLLKIVRGDARPAKSALPAALGATANFYTLRTRLELVRNSSEGDTSRVVIPPLRRGAVALLAAAGAAALVPWRPVAGEASGNKSQSATVLHAQLADGLPLLVSSNDGDMADVSAWDLKAGGDPAKRYLLIGLPDAGATPPPGGYRLMVVLPGGDGGIEFNGWVRRIQRRALGPEYIVAELIAPRWDDRQASEVVWPTRTNPWPSMRFSTEEFMAAVVRDVARRVPVNPQHVYALGWASGGPPIYAAGLAPDIPIRGAFVAMSVYDRSWLPPLSGASAGRPFFLLHPEDAPIAPRQQAERAQRDLSAAGAPVELVTYQGGYGWHGDVYAQLRRGVAYLESHSQEQKKKVVQ